MSRAGSGGRARRLAESFDHGPGPEPSAVAGRRLVPAAVPYNDRLGDPPGGVARGGRVRRLYEDPWLSLHFAEDRLVSRFHLAGVPPGRPVAIDRVAQGTGERIGVLGAAVVGADGWVDQSEPIAVRAGEGFIVVPEGGPGG